MVVTSLYPTADRPEVGSFVAQRVEWLRRTGHVVTVVAAADYRAGGLRRHWAMLREVAAERSIAVDGVEGHVLFPAGLVAATAARLHRVPLLLYAHGSDVARSAFRSPVHRILAASAARSAQAVVANSRATAGYVRRLGVRAEIIPPGVDMDVFRPGDRSAARRKLGLSGQVPIALFLGRLDGDKGPDVFAEAVSGLVGWTGLIVGNGPLEPQLRARWPLVQYHHGIRHSAVPDWVRASDVVVVPSRSEGLGLVAVEALACGVPVIAARVGGLAEVVSHDDNGKMVDPGDPQAIRDALGELAAKGRRAQLASRARDSVASHDIRLTTASMNQLWRNLGAPT